MAVAQTQSASTRQAISPPVARPTPVRFADTVLGRRLVRAFLFSASIKLAVSLLSLFTLCLITATLLESSYTARVARELIYHTWWFTVLLCLLAVNILCAALKKLPWKRHQIGFLITHTGLLVLVFGGLLTNLGGVEGQMMLLDTDNREIHEVFRMSDRSDTVQLVDEQRLEIYRVPKDQAKTDSAMLKEIVDLVNGGLEMSDSLKKKLDGHHWTYGLKPGSFAWRDDKHLRSELPAGIDVLRFLADPMPGFSRRLDSETRLTIENHYPTTERRPFSQATSKEDEDTFPALLLKLTTPMMPRPVRRWVTSLPSLEPDPTPIGFDFLVLQDPVLLPEFLNPPSKADLGTAGQLVVALGEDKGILRVSLDKVKEGGTLELKSIGVTFKLGRRADLMELLGRFGDAPLNPQAPAYPAVEFELSSAKGKGNYISCARLPHLRAFRDGVDVVRTSAWLHHPDFRWGQTNKMGALQFLKGPDGKVYYRAYGKDGLREPGKELNVDDPSQVVELPFKPMSMKMEVQAWLPEAVRKESIVPRNLRPGAEPSERLEPALRCTLESDGEKKEVWARLGRGATQVNVGNEIFFVRYMNGSRRLDFDLKLQAARQVSDPGTNRPASFESDVVLHPKEGGEEDSRDFRISMNNTLDHGGFKVYQTNYRPMQHPQTGELLLDENGRLVSMSGFTVADDPGLWSKYIGSCLLVLGIATMFFMRAYFFKPRRRSVQPLAA